MTVIMVLLTFAIFLLIDYVRTQKLAKQTAVQAARREAAPRVVPALVAGFQVPENVRYHAGHTWALSESHEMVRVGMDDFASKLVGKIESIALPQRGRWVRAAGGRYSRSSRRASTQSRPCQPEPSRGSRSEPRYAPRDSGHFREPENRQPTRARRAAPLHDEQPAPRSVWPISECERNR